MFAAPVLADDEPAVRRCWPAFQQLRPNLPDEDEFVRRWRQQHAEGYRIHYVEHGGEVAGVFGHRLMSTMIWGRVLYLDDLFVGESWRGTGLGRHLLDTIERLARAAGCASVQLDTGFQRFAAHRSYLRNGYQLSCHHLTLSLAGD
ncbi:MAG TPA: GNAT family N-acetyltransferase [Jatrophihabitans sp.]|nr:GNAT family N-acetyltransferase [Jatrophihabitans sp.]